MESIATLSQLLKLAEGERDAAAAWLRQCEAAASHARGQGEHLDAYRGEYIDRWGTRFRQQGTPQLLQCYQGFNGRLDQAIAQQARTIVQAGNRVELARAALLVRELRVASVRKLIERRNAELRRASARREQRQTDEAAQRSVAGPHLNFMM